MHVSAKEAQTVVDIPQPITAGPFPILRIIHMLRSQPVFLIVHLSSTNLQDHFPSDHFSGEIQGNVDRVYL